MKRVAIFIGVCVGLLGLFVVVSIVAGELFFSKDTKKLHALCLQTKKGVTLDELKKMFGPVVSDSAQAGLRRPDGLRNYGFGSQDYSVLYSAYIFASVNEATGQVVSLSCDEGNYAFK